MPGYTPPRPSERTVAAALLVVVVGLVWSVLLARLDAALVALGLAVVAYVVWRFLRALEAVADGTQRIAAAQEGAPDGSDDDAVGTD